MGCAGDLLHWEGIWVFFHCTSDWVCRDPRDAQCFYLWSGSRNCLAAADRSWCVTKWLRERQIKQYSQRQIPVFPVPSGSMEPSFGQYDLCMLLRFPAAKGIFHLFFFWKGAGIMIQCQLGEDSELISIQVSFCGENS